MSTPIALKATLSRSFRKHQQQLRGSCSSLPTLPDQRTTLPTRHNASSSARRRQGRCSRQWCPVKVKVEQPDLVHLRLNVW